jgi:hypothetical protein
MKDIIKLIGLNLARLLLALILSPIHNSRAEEIVALTSSGSLIRFDSTSPSTIISTVSLSGLSASDSLATIDFRPGTGELYGIGIQSRVYKINPNTGVVALIGTTFSPTLSGTSFSANFNPVVDRIRVVSNTGQNIRINPRTGLVSGTDTSLAYAVGDVAFGVTPRIAAAAYNQNSSGTTTSTIFGFDSTANTLVRMGSVNGSPTSPNSGNLFTIGSVGIDITDTLGFDISGVSANGYVAATLAGGSTSTLYSVNLTSGALTSVGVIGGSSTVLSLAITPAPVTTLWGSNGGSTVTRFTAEGPGNSLNSFTVTGLIGGDTIKGIDTRPADGGLYLLGSGGRLYTLNTTTEIATQVGSGTFSTPLSGSNFGFDVNPVVDRVRVVSDADQNLRLNPTTGAVSATDSSLAYAVGDVSFGANPNIVAIGYSNNYSGSISTTVYGLDSTSGDLVFISPPNFGTLNTVGFTGLSLSSTASLDIVGNNTFGYLSNGGTLYAVTLANGATLALGTLPSGIVDITAAQVPVVQWSSSTYSAREGDGTATLTIHRSSNTSGTSLVQYSVAAGTATSDDVAITSGTITFLDQESTKSIPITLTDDSGVEANETFTVTLSSPQGAMIGSNGIATVTIIDSDVTGRVIDKNGAGVSGVSISDGTHTVTTNSTGYYLFNNEADGSYTATPTLGKRIFSPNSRSFTVASVGQSGIDFTLVGAADDIDGDGHVDAAEKLLGSSSTSSTSVPFGALLKSKALSKTKLAVKLDFKNKNKDTILLTGTLSLPKGTVLTGKKLVVDVGGVVKAFTLSKNGKASAPYGQASISTPSAMLTRTVTLSLKNGSFASALGDELLSNASVKGARKINVKIYLSGGSVFSATKSGSYAAKKNINGSFNG